tara:strand:+ start:401 stop:643 length:243 start_codon:yes stop_codon:yes gene_type:complete
MADNTLSQIDQDFAHAMALKLRLNREQRNSQTSEMSALANEPSEQTVGDSLRNSIIQAAMQDHPGLTEETAQKMLDELGG